jgi:hypothetical protein
MRRAPGFSLRKFLLANCAQVSGWLFYLLVSGRTVVDCVRSQNEGDQ